MEIPKLESERLILKPVSIDVHLTESYVSWLNDPDICQFLETGGNYTMDMLRDYLVTISSKGIFFWAIHLKSTDKHIGNIKIDPVNFKHGLGEYGILMGEKKEWGKGYAKEASDIVINFCFRSLHLRKITLGVVSQNFPAIKLYNLLGFSIEGNYKLHGIYNGVYMDMLRMAKFNSNWQ